MTLKRLNFLSWPIWVKLAVGFFLAIALPVILAVAALQPGLREIQIQTLQAYVSENGERQRIAVSNALTQARSNLTSFLNNDSYNRRLTVLLLNNSARLVNEAPLDADPASISTLFRDVLLNRSTTLYNSVRLLDRNGQLMTQTTLGNPTAGSSQQDQSRTVAYRAAVTEQLKQQGQDQLLVVYSRTEDPIIELVDIIRWRDGQPIGYLITELNNTRVLYENLTFSDSVLPAYTFLVAPDLATTQNLLISPAQWITQAGTSINGEAVQRAQRGEIGTDSYTIAASEELVGYFSAIPGTSMVLVAEVPARFAASAGQSLIDVRLFVIVLVTLALVIVLVIFFNQVIVPPLLRLRSIAQSVINGDFQQPVQDLDRGDEIGLLAISVLNMREQVESLIKDLEARIAARNRDINATQEISRYAATQRDLQMLMDKVVNLIIERFQDIYHAQIFLVDQDRQHAVLRASTGEPGRKLLERGHRLGVGSISVIGQVTEQGRVVVARDTAASQVHRRNEFLPDTVAELAIPLRIGDSVIGALDVQSRRNDAFNEDNINVLQTMADQIAIAIQNARLYQESVRRLDDIERNNQLATLRAWEDFMRDKRMREFTIEVGPELQEDTSELRLRALETGAIAVGLPTRRQTIPIAVPILLRGQVLGAVEWELPEHEIDNNRLQLAQELANRLAISLDNARLFEESQRATERERLVNNIASKLTAQTDINEILQTAVREVGQALRSPQVSIRLHRVGENGNGHHSDDVK